jgi:hypothetical protein
MRVEQRAPYLRMGPIGATAGRKNIAGRPIDLLYRDEATPRP